MTVAESRSCIEVRQLCAILYVTLCFASAGDGKGRGMGVVV